MSSETKLLGWRDATKMREACSMPTTWSTGECMTSTGRRSAAMDFSMSARSTVSRKVRRMRKACQRSHRGLALARYRVGRQAGKTRKIC